MAYNFNLGPLNVHQGSLLGLPDFGVTEAVGNLLGTPRTNQGGSNLSSIFSGAQGGGGGVNYSPVTSSINTNQQQQTTPTNTQSVLGTNTQQTGGNTGGGTDPYASLRSDISNAWDQYINSLGGVSDFFNQQQKSQSDIANNQYNQNVNTANAQRASSLRDIANSTRSAFQAGNNFLGALGAGDSSAANQYAFAINKQSGKQIGDLNNFVNGQVNGFKSNLDNQLSSIANWFAGQQATLKQQIAQGGLNKAQDLNGLSMNILNQAIAATNQAKADAQNKYNVLLQWAANQSSSLPQLTQNIAQIPQAIGAINLQGGGSQSPAYYAGYSGSPTQKTDIFGNPITG